MQPHPALRLLPFAALVAALGTCPGPARAATNNFIVPAFRGLEQGTHGYWESFSVPFGSPGNAPDQPGSTATALLTQSLSPSTFVTGTGNLYDPSGTVGFTLTHSVPFTLGTVVLQTRTLGSEWDYDSFRLTYSVGSEEHHLAPMLALELDRGTVLGASVSTLHQWDLRGLNISDYSLSFQAAGSSLSLDSVTLDAWEGFLAVPEPGLPALALLGTALLATQRLRRRRSA